MSTHDEEIRLAFRARFDPLRPRPGAADRAFEAVAAGERGHGFGRRLAGVVAVGIALLVVLTLVVARQALSVHPASVPASTPAAASVPPVAPVNQPRPELIVALNPSVVLAGWSDSGEVRLTQDAGATWKTVRPAAPGAGAPLYDLQWLDADDVLAATGTGLYRFQPSTAAWTQLSPRSDLIRLDFFDVSEGYAVTADGDLVETTDGARTVSKRDVGLKPVTWVQWLSRSRAWAVGPQGIVTTRDGGVTWTRQLTLPDSGPGVVTWAQVGFRDTSNGFAIFDLAGQALGRQAYVVYHTADGGANWTATSCTCGFAAVPDWLRRGAPATLPEEAHGDLLVTGPSSALLVTTRPAPSSSVSICATTDAGANWSCGAAPFAGAGTGALAARGSTWWLVADTASVGPLIAVTRDGGATWATAGPA